MAGGIDEFDPNAFEERFFDELGGRRQYSIAYDYSDEAPARPGDQIPYPENMEAGRLDLGALEEMYPPAGLGEGGLARPKRSADNFRQAREAAANFLGNPIRNRKTGIVATVSRNSLDKMLSRSAAQKSSSMKEHMDAVANIDALFADAVPGWSKRRDDDPSDLKAVHRLFAPMRTERGAVLVKLTVKEMAQQGQNRIYTVESLSVNEESPVPEMVDADRAEGSRLLTGPTGLVDSLVREIQLINSRGEGGDESVTTKESLRHRLTSGAGGQDARGQSGKSSEGGISTVLHGLFNFKEACAAENPLVGHLRALGMTARDGLHPGIVADMFGFDSADALLRQLAAAPPPRQAIEARTEARMLEAHGDITSPEAVVRAADEAVANAARRRTLSTEVNALLKMIGRPRQNMEVVRELVAEQIAGMRVRDLLPGRHSVAASREAREKLAAFKRGETEAAARHARNELFSREMERAILEAQDRRDSIFRYVSKMARGKPRALKGEYYESIMTILGGIDFSRSMPLKEADNRAALIRELNEWQAAVAQEDGVEIEIPDYLKVVSRDYRPSVKNMTMEELEGLYAAVRQIDHTGREAGRIERDGIKISLGRAVDELVGSISSAPRLAPKDRRAATTKTGRLREMARSFLAQHTKVSTYANIFDGGRDGGPWASQFLYTANARATMQTSMRADIAQRIAQILKPYLSTRNSAPVFFPSVSRSFNRQELLAIALNVGNEGNLERLLAGEGWSLPQVMPLLESLTVEEWGAVQGVWDTFESLKPQVAEQARRVDGVEPEWIGTKPFRISAANGVFEARGGYYPVKYDPAASDLGSDMSAREQAAADMKAAYTAATTRHTFLKSRVRKIQPKRPLAYNLSGMYQGLEEVVHDLAWREWTIGMNRLLRNRKLTDAIRQHGGSEALAQFKDWVRDIAEGDRKSGEYGAEIASFLRKNVSLSALAFNPTTALLQATGIAQTAARIGMGWVGVGIKRVLGNSAVQKGILEHSEFIRNRARTAYRELSEIRDRIDDPTGWAGRLQRATAEYGMLPLLSVQIKVDMVSYEGAYQRYVSEGFEDAKARQMAEQVVIDSQGSGQKKDLAAIQRGGVVMNLLTVFYDYQNVRLNQLLRSYGTGGLKGLAKGSFWVVSVDAVIAEWFIRGLLTPGEPDDDEALLMKLAALHLESMLGLFVGVRELQGTVSGYGYQGPAGLRLVSNSYKLFTQIGQGKMDAAAAKAAVSMLAPLGVPTGEINRIITGTAAYAEGKTGNPAAVVMGYDGPR